MVHWKPATASSPEVNVSWPSSTTHSSSLPMQQLLDLLWICSRDSGSRGQNEEPATSNHALERMAQQVDPRARVWRGSQVPADEQGRHQSARNPLGHADFVSPQLETVLEEQHILLNRIPRVQDVQSAWLILLHCASARVNCCPCFAPSSTVNVRNCRCWLAVSSILQLGS